MPIDLSGDAIGAWTQARLVNFIENVITNKMSGNEVFRMMDVAHSLDGQISTQELADSAVTGPKIASGSISNTKFVNGYPALTLNQAVCSADLTLTTTPTDITSVTMSLGTGIFLFTGICDMDHTVNGAGVAVGELVVGGSTQGGNVIFQNSGAAGGDRASVVQQWVVSLGAGPTTCKLRAYKTINAGTAIAHQTHTQLIALRTT